MTIGSSTLAETIARCLEVLLNFFGIRYDKAKETNEKIETTKPDMVDAAIRCAIAERVRRELDASKPPAQP